MTYCVTYTIDIEAESPTEAARAAEVFMQREFRAYEPAFTVVDSETGVEHFIDLDAERSLTWHEEN